MQGAVEVEVVVLDLSEVEEVDLGVVEVVDMVVVGEGVGK